MFLAAVVQMTSTSDETSNWEQVVTLTGQAAGHGAALVATPENTNFLGPHAEKVARAEPIGGPTTSRFAELARRHKIHLLLGSYNEKCEENPQRCYNTSVLFGPDGDVVATYRKIHLFDVDVSSDVRFMESDTVKAGEKIVVAETPLGRIGMSICYDLRFPELYRKLTDAGAEILAIPSAFTLTTGKDHWEALIRARAIENQAYVLAPGQHGKHDDQGLRNSYGHSMIVDPWGHVIARSSDGPHIAVGVVDLGRVREVRRGMPVSAHRRLN